MEPTTFEDGNDDEEEEEASVEEEEYSHHPIQIPISSSERGDRWTISSSTKNTSSTPKTAEIRLIVSD